MARIRTVKPDFWSDEKIMELSPLARLLFIGTWNFADDNGNLDRSSKQMKAKIFPADSVDVEILIGELKGQGLMIEYEVNGKRYLHIKNFRVHQKINRPSDPKCPLFNDDSVIPHGVLTDPSPTEGKGREEEGKVKEEDLKAVEETAAAKIFRSCFNDNESIIRKTFPTRDYTAEMETCIAHFSNQPPPLDPKATIFKWFNRAHNKPAAAEAKTFASKMQENTINALKSLQEDIDNGQTGLEAIFGTGSNIGNGIRGGSEQRKTIGVHNGTVRLIS